MTEDFPIARCLFIGKVLLGYTECEVWRMTPRKLLILYGEYKNEYGREKEAESLDDVIPL